MYSYARLFSGSAFIRVDLRRKRRGCRAEREPVRECPLCANDRPNMITTAALIWLGCGGILLGGAVALLPSRISFVEAEGGFSAAVSAVYAVVASLIGGMFVIAGMQTYRGRARDTLGNAVGSVYLGVLVDFGGGGMYGTMLGALMIGAGGMAFLGRRRYKAWREARHTRTKEDATVDGC